MYTQQQIKQNLVNQTARAIGALADFDKLPDDVFLTYLIALEHSVRQARGQLTIRKIMDTNDDTSEDDANL